MWFYGLFVISQRMDLWEWWGAIRGTSRGTEHTKCKKGSYVAFLLIGMYLSPWLQPRWDSVAHATFMKF